MGGLFVMENNVHILIRILLDISEVDTPSMKMIMNLCKQDRLDAWGSLRVAFT